MISDELVQFLKKPVMMGASSRNGDLRPHSTRGFGPLSISDDKVITFYTSKAAEEFIEDCKTSGRVALVTCDATSFETYQFKGRFIISRECDENDHAAVDEYVGQGKDVIIGIGFPEEAVTGWAVWECKPCVAISFEVDDVFHQSPGPGTGDPIQT